MECNVIINNYVNKKSKGGPPGYLFNLMEGLKILEHPNIRVNLYSNQNESHVDISKKAGSLKKSIRNTLFSISPGLYERKLISSMTKLGITYVRKLNLEEILKGGIVHFHTAYDLYNMNRFIKDKPKILTTHSPESLHIEICNELKGEYRANYDFPQIAKFYKEIETFSFNNADYLIFPSEEALDPYLETVYNFEDIIKGKKIYYMMTGTKEMDIKMEREESRVKYGIRENDFVVSYIGRHNSVKGYDILCKAAELVWEKDPSICFLTAGIGDIESPKNKKWIDIGWTNDPGSLVNCSDLFVLPNRRTYFDLVLLEVMSIGKPIIASNTGGNKTVKKYTDGIITYDMNDIRALANIILQLADQRDILLNMGKQNKTAYYANFTIKKFAERYISALENIGIDLV